MAEKLITPKELADLVRSNENTLAYWRHMGTGPRWAKLGRRIVYRESDVQSWIDDQFAASH